MKTSRSQAMPQTQTTDTAPAKTREARIHSAFYHGDALTLANPAYLRAVGVITGELLRQDAGGGDLTVRALGVDKRKCSLEIRAKQDGVAAGVSEAAWLCDEAGLRTEILVRDGESFARGDAVFRAAGNAGELLKLERTVVDLLQRMCGIATATRHLCEAVARVSATAHILGTRKTLWGLLDKRAIHLGGGATHRLSLSDAILIKTNHLRLAANGEDRRATIRRAWENRGAAAFFEVEAMSGAEALATADLLRSFEPDASCPCALMLDNFSPEQARQTVSELQRRRWYDSVLMEASGKIDESSAAQYAAAGMDALSVGALTHSVRALDLNATVIPEVIRN